ncbi:MAG: hydrolase 1, exosortase A system-associated [Novosphingobium sp.]|nr:hydrolase 1, exosortase A system-associated [Novosphingobium sp.]MCP5402415.1 hydrolase 1, exosortase A system-associated [Novosphingobium sp.]
MSRRHLTFTCEGSQLFGTLDEGEAGTGLLLVTGGNEIRSGAWAGQAQLAARLAGEGYPVFRFDRRGVGDSEGPNGGFRSSGPDIAAALTAFRNACPNLTRVVGFGNCDAASALMLAKAEGLDALVLSNPWTIETEDAAAPPEAVRDHYKRRLSDPAAIKRLLTGKVSLKKLVGGLRDAMRPAPEPTTLTTDMAAEIEGFSGPIVFLVAERDRTGQVFLSAWPKDDPRIRRCADATHSYVEAGARDWLAGQVLEMLRS